ncbi:MAG TPA: alpha/beta fold hydrolase [Solirubrobacteraceae bacterium]|nr:alpha/beta fold hydrolase [Solirubrobacteraceae bacterium]
MSFHREGRGPPLVLLHGIGHHRQAWRPVIDRLAGEFDVIACDLPGFGWSDPLPPGVDPAIPAYVGAFERWFGELGLECPHVAGNSMGGAIAPELARRDAARRAGRARLPQRAGGLRPLPLRGARPAGRRGPRHGRVGHPRLAAALPARAPERGRDLCAADGRIPGMSIARSTRARAGAALAALALLGPAAPAAADGLPLPVDDSPNGVAALAGDVRYLSVAIGNRTAVLAQRVKDGAVTSRLELRGSFGIPLVAYDSTAGGISADGRTLVLINPRKGFPRQETTFAILSTARRLRRTRILRLRGDFSYDALSPDGRSLFLVNYISAKDPTKYRVRVYDLARHRLVAQPVVDPRESPGEMYGLPVTRVSSPDDRWAYTLYDAQGERPFIHALDTIDRKAVCIDLDGPAFASNFAYDLKLAVAAGGKRLDVTRKGARIASVDTATFRAGPPAPSAVPAAPARRVDPTGPDPLWPAAAAALLGLALGIRSMRARRRSRTSAPADYISIAS